MSGVSARAVVRVLVEVQDVSGGWGGDCTIRQAQEQATEYAVNKVRKAVEAPGGAMRVLRAESVEVIITEDALR